jgi:RHS repeat-associated protein
VLFKSYRLSKAGGTAARAIAVFIISSMIASISPAQAEIFGGYGREAVESTYNSSNSPVKHYPLSAQEGNFSGRIEDTSEREASVAHINLCPRRLTLYVGEAFTLVPMAVDHKKEAVHGVAMTWESNEATLAPVSSYGRVSALAAGRATITVRAGQKQANVHVEVINGARPITSDSDWDIQHKDDCVDPESVARDASQKYLQEQEYGAVQASSRNEFDDETEYEQYSQPRVRPAVLRVSRSSAPRAVKAVAVKRSSSPTPFTVGDLIDGDSDDTISAQAASFRNAVGSPRFGAQETTPVGATKTRKNLGSYNYLFSAPVLGLGGRGIGVNLAMVYNSRLWNKDGNTMTFNYNKGWPAAGWTLGYGRIIKNYDGTAGGSNNSPGNYLLIQPDGTRIHLQQSNPGGVWRHDSTDGTFLRLNAADELIYPDGTTVYYNLHHNRLLPATIKTRNGQTINIAYRARSSSFPYRWAIEQIYDTLGRYITFRYYGEPGYPADEANGKPLNALAAITAPDFSGGASERTMIKIEYQTITLRRNFRNSITVNGPVDNSPLNVVKRIYYPQTGRGYLFLDYSTYGMARHISVRKDMTGPGGTTNDGTEIAYTKYNYVDINNQSGQLDDSPQYTEQSEWWQGKTDSNGNPDSNPTLYRFTRSSGTDDNGYSTEIDTTEHVGNNFFVVTKTGNDPINAPESEGKVVTTEYKNSTSVLGKNITGYSYELGGGVQISSVETFDENGTPTKVSYNYGNYGRVKNVYEYGYKQSGNYVVRRRTFYNYSDSDSHLQKNLYHLVNKVEVLDGNNVPIARTVYLYDDYAIKGGMEYYGLNTGSYPPNHDWDYDQTRTSRGNVTGVQTWSNLTTDTYTVQYTKYDIFGNVVEADVSCCMAKTYHFAGNATGHYYSQPDWVRDGSAMGPSLTTSFQYNFNTGLVTQMTNPDGLNTTYEYDSAWRVLKVISPTAASVTTQPDRDSNGNDQLAYSEQLGYKDGSTTKVINNKIWIDGAGHVLRSGTGAGISPSSFDTVATVYDPFGRVLKQSNPYTGDSSGNGTPQHWTKNIYDDLSRVKEVLLPDDQPSGQRSRVVTTYAGASASMGVTVTVKDQVGRERKSEMDGLGRLVKATEQDPASGGSLSLATIYEYDVLDNLKRVDQGGQIRNFNYDAKSRLTSQTTPEAGTVSFTYTQFDAVADRTDARGVITTFDYDELNRPFRISHNNKNAPGVAATPGLEISYKTGSPGKGQLLSVSDGSWNEGFTYDLQGRVASKTSGPYTTQYLYNNANQITTLVYPSGKRLKVNRDLRGRLTGLDSINTMNSVLATYVSTAAYNTAGQVTGLSLGNGATESYGYSTDGRQQLASQTVTKSGSTLMSLTYGYQAAAGANGAGTVAGNTGQVMNATGTVNGQGRNQTFGYDNVGRLVTAGGWSSSTNRRFSYDRWGNRTGMWNAVSGGSQMQNINASTTSNRISSINNVPYSYDGSGNVTWDGGMSYVYDAENRLASVNGGSVASYVYDSSNRRVKKTTAAGTTVYVWEGSQVIAEYNEATGALMAEYVYAGARMVAREQGGAMRYYHADRLSTRLITDGAGNVVSTQDHMPFGEDAGATGESSKHRFTSYERDSETGTDYAVNRQHQNANGRFMQPDPISGNIGNPQSLNRYSYVQNDPVNLVDPEGLFPNIAGAITSALTGFSLTHQVSAGGWTVEIVPIPAGFLGGPIGGGIGELPIGNVTFGGILAVLPRGQTDVCSPMADLAQKLANEALDQTPGSASSEALEKFDKAFSQQYLGNDGIGTSLYSAWKFSRAPYRPKVPHSMRGEGGFHPRLQDGTGEQTHHFAAFLSAGINQQDIVAVLHREIADYDNIPDKLLSRAAYQIGEDLRKDPVKLNLIGDMIRKRICGQR